MKILGGTLKGRNFYMPPDIRPTQNVVRKAIFDILGDVEGLDFLELFAGSGAVGFEAYSRGAKSVTFIEKNPSCLEVIQENCRLLGIDIMDPTQTPVRVRVGDVFEQIPRLAQQKQKFDIIFCDPPFLLEDQDSAQEPQTEVRRRKIESETAKKTLKCLGAHDILTPNCLIIVQCYRRETLPEAEGRVLAVRERFYGASLLKIYKVAS